MHYIPTRGANGDDKKRSQQLQAIEAAMVCEATASLKRLVQRGIQHKLEQGGYPYRAPAGYLNDSRAGTIQADPERFPLLRKAWELMLTGRCSAEQVVTELNRLGYRTRKTLLLAD